jgi:hypothetical protein
MSLQIAVAHTGQRLDADPVAFSSVDALKHWISRASEIAPESQILLTPGGKHVKLQALLTEVWAVPYVLLHQLTNVACRRRSLSIAVSCRITPRLPHRPRPYQMPSPPMTLQTPSRTIQTYEHGRRCFRPAATGPSASSRSRTPCPASPPSTSPNKLQ